MQGPASQVCVPTEVPTPERRGQGGAPPKSPSLFQAILKNHPSTPINIQALSSALSSHPDPVFVDHLLTGLSQGFRVGVLSDLTTNHVSRNLQSAIKDHAVVASLLEKEVTKGHMVGPFPSPPFKPFRINPIGIATRKYSGKKRLIIDLSAPRNGPCPSVNSMIPLEHFSLYYVSIDDAIRLIKIAGQGAWLAKADITDAFKIMPIHPSQWSLFGVKWEKMFYFAVRLTFGCRSSPHIFNAISEALCWILLNVVRLPFVLHLLDDFLLIDFPSSSPDSLPKLKATFDELGVPLSAEKTVGPVKSIEFLGIVLDSEKMEASLPLEKLTRIRELIAGAGSPITKQQLLSLLGHFNYAMRIIPQGRSFIARLLELASSVANLHDSISLDSGCHSDLAFWSKLLNDWNGISFFYNELETPAHEMHLYTDAAPSIGFGGVFQGEWFADSWPSEMRQSTPCPISIAHHELYPIAVACNLWGSQWTRRRITFHCDNEATVNIINKGRSSSQEIMPLMRFITWTSVMHNFIVKAAHVPGCLNNLADCLSRFKFQEFLQRCPTAKPFPLVCPAYKDLVLY